MKWFIFLVLIGAGATASNLNAQTQSDGRLVWLKPHQVVIDSTQLVECLYAVIGEDVARTSFIEAEKEANKREWKTKVKWFIFGTACGVVIKTITELVK